MSEQENTRRLRNELEVAMAAGAADAAARPHFYEVLLRSQVLVLPAGELPVVVDGVVLQEQTLRLLSHDIEGIRHIACYSSVALVPADMAYLELAVTDLFGITRGQHLILNPHGPHTKCFLPDEVRSLLDGTLLSPPRMNLEAGARQMLGMPQHAPRKMEEAVVRYLAAQPGVDRAYLVQHFVQEIHSKPAILIAVFASQEFADRIVGAISVIAKDTMEFPQEVDVVCYPVRDDAGRNFARFGPIYRRPRRNLLARLVAKVMA